MQLSLIVKFLILIILFLLMKYYWKKWTDKCNSQKTIIQYNQNELNLKYTLPNINYDNKHNGINYVFWTGGYDSTFRICQLLLLENKVVQPIYICCGNTDDDVKLFDFNKQVKRANVNIEKKKMYEIRLELKKQYPEIANRLLSTWYVVNLKENIEITDKYKNIHKYLGFFSRNITQYERMARFSIEMDLPIEICVENCGIGMDKATKDIRIGVGDTCKISVEYMPVKYMDMIIFKNLRYPIVHLTKENMKLISLNNGFYSILQMTWSCWFPTPDCKPCGKCKMCSERII